MEATPAKTAWQGFYRQFGKQHAIDFDNIVFDHGRALRGGGSDECGQFEFRGKYTDSGVKFTKVYTSGSERGAHPLTYEGKFHSTPEGTKIVGRYYWRKPDDGDGFEMLRSKDLEERREAAFKSVVAGMKVKAGLIRLFTEDLWMALCKLTYLIFHNDDSTVQLLFTILSLLAGLAMTAVGPFLESRVARVMAEASRGLPPPTIAEGAKKGQASAVDAAEEKAAMAGYRRMAEEGDEEEEREYQRRLNAAEEITTMEYLTGNLDYIAVLMEQRHKPAEVIDIAITDIVAGMPIIQMALVMSSGLFWAYTVSFPLLFAVPCQEGIPAAAHLVFFCTAFFNIFIQIWCASLTKYGYLMLVHAPQMYAFDTGLSLLGLFSSYSSVAWIVMVRSCGVWLWKPAAVIYFVGMIALQAVPGIYLLVTCRHLPLALRLTQNNLLIALLKPNP